MAVAPVEKVKAWLTPTLMTCFGMLMWSLISEIRTDVKALLAANAEVQIKIQNLERRMEGAEDVIYSQRVFAIKPEDIEVPKRNTQQAN